MDVTALAWRLEKAAEYAAAVPWLRESTTFVDTTRLTPAAVADAVLHALDADLSGPAP